MGVSGISGQRTKPIPVRLDEKLQRRLKNAARKMGSSASGVIRFSVIQQLPAIESGRVRLVESK